MEASCFPRIVANDFLTLDMLKVKPLAATTKIENKGVVNVIVSGGIYSGR